MRRLTEAHDAEHDCQNDKSTELNWFAANSIDSCDRDPVTRDSTSANEDQVTDGDVVEDLVDAVALGVTNRLQDSCVIETDTVESNVKEEPRASRTEQDLSVLPLAIVLAEVAPGSLGDLHARCRVAHFVDASNLVGNALRGGREVGLDVGSGLDDITRDIEGVTWGLRDGQTVVKGNTSGHSAEADDNTPHLINSDATDAAALVDLGGRKKGLLEADSDDERHDTSSELTDTLHGEDRAHHGSAPLGGSELGGNDGAERVVTSDTNCAIVSIASRSTLSVNTLTSHEHTPEDDSAND